jgi:hypothetical protein
MILDKDDGKSVRVKMKPNMKSKKSGDCVAAVGWFGIKISKGYFSVQTKGF